MPTLHSMATRLTANTSTVFTNQLSADPGGIKKFFLLPPPPPKTSCISSKSTLGVWNSVRNYSKLCNCPSRLLGTFLLFSSDFLFFLFVGGTGEKPSVESGWPWIDSDFAYSTLPRNNMANKNKLINTHRYSHQKLEIKTAYCNRTTTTTSAADQIKRINTKTTVH